jgi:L-threonylcarbamoyladenylate synthase
MNPESILKQGGLIALPTDTVFALACLATDAAARTRFYAVKNRAEEQPAILMVGSIESAQLWARFGPEARRLAREHWPGPLTLILPGTPRALRELGQIVHDRTVAIRIPAHPVALSLIGRVEGPLCTSSANRAGKAPPRTAAEARAALGDAVEMVLDGDQGSGVPSSILDLTRKRPRVLRVGSIPAERLLS